MLFSCINALICISCLLIKYLIDKHSDYALIVESNKLWRRAWHVIEKLYRQVRRNS